MRRYWVEIEGTGIDVPASESDQRIRGFIARKIIDAESPAEASEAALESVRADWASGFFAFHGATPQLKVTRAETAGLLKVMMSGMLPYKFRDR